MSDILIKGMEMPNICAYCFIESSECNLHESVNIWKERHPDCPLIELPPHGRLIDATFEENHYGSMLLNPTPDVTVEDRKKAKAIIDALHMARTVIEAEGETDGR